MLIPFATPNRIAGTSSVPKLGASGSPIIVTAYSTKPALIRLRDEKRRDNRPKRNEVSAVATEVAENSAPISTGEASKERRSRNGR